MTNLPGASRQRTKQRTQQRTRLAALALFCCAGLIPETVATFNSPPLLLLANPAALAFICAFYGSVALLVREFIRSRGARWASVLLLGAAAGAVNEGMIAGTWYRAQYRGYALIGGIDPAVAVGLTVFHALVSTVLPITLANLVFPRVADRSWLSRPWRYCCLALLALTTVAGFSRPADRGAKLIVLLGVLAAAAIALALPAAADRMMTGGPVPRLRTLRTAGALATVAFFAVFTVIPGLTGAAVHGAGLYGWQLIYILLMCGLFAVVILAGRRWSTRAGWGQRQALAVCTGVLLPAIALSFVAPAALGTLEPVVTIPALALLIWLARRYGKDPEASVRLPRPVPRDQSLPGPEEHGAVSPGR